ncbi:hypothetical protein KIN20_027188 [Parelaphostrongylus tenuis]|uniref:Uncharacterized protein n=1 Tax=Parelaphostrongylus tenuis TaxID=148309 RepID=A0AAD5QZ36_PARTN|nr:hypothetical protein KIN20_027188 [Parelaphostrongylus tenuis]
MLIRRLVNDSSNQFHTTYVQALKKAKSPQSRITTTTNNNTTNLEKMINEDVFGKKETKTLTTLQTVSDLAPMTPKQCPPTPSNAFLRLVLASDFI